MELAGSVAHLMGFPAEQVDDVKTAVLEATINAIEHGNRLNSRRKVSILITPDGERLEIVVRDRSRRPLEVPSVAPNLEEQIAGRAPRRGWGVFLIRSLVDEVEFVSTGRGNLVRMVVHARQPKGDMV